MTANDRSSEVAKGLAGITIDESDVSMVDGGNGDIWYAGYHIDALARQSSFEETLYLLWHRALPTAEDLEQLRTALAEQRDIPADVATVIEQMAQRATPMDVLRTAVSMLVIDGTDPDAADTAEANLQAIVARIPTIIASLHRYRQGRDPVPPRSDLGHAENFLYMLTGDIPEPTHATALDTALVLYADHGMNASTFAGRVTTSTRSNPYAAITSALGTLQGPLHGGATETVIRTLQEVGDPAHVEDWVDDTLDRGEAIPGFGHRVYEVADPRCRHFQRQIEAVDPDGEVQQWYATANALRTAVEERLGAKGIRPNTDLYSGTLFRALDIPPEQFTTTFAMGRVAGWAAHVLEQQADNRLIRPRIEYVGDTGREYTPIDER